MTAGAGQRAEECCSFQKDFSCALRLRKLKQRDPSLMGLRPVEVCMQGKIVKGIAGFYYVDVAGSGIYECRAKGIFRKEKLKPLVGDDVEIEVLDEKDREGNVMQVLPRKNQLVRPAVANVDQAMVIFSVRQPDPNLALLDRFLIAMERQGIPVVICLNKTDLDQGEETGRILDIYTACGYLVIPASMKEQEGIRKIRQILRGKTTVVAGPSGVGKSSLTNLMQEEISMETGEISRKLKRGRHTTRHSQLIELGEQTYLMDTPGFSSLFVEEMDKEELRRYFPEFEPYEGECRFQGCVHIHEPGCAVKEALEEGKLDPGRYANYVSFFEELKEKEKRRY